MSSASKINGSRHGLLSQTVVLEEESTTRFQELLMGYMDEYQPATASQVSLVETMAVARWRQLRVWGAQKTAMDRDMALQDPNIGPAPVRVLSALRGSPDSSCPPEVLLRYEIAFDRQFSRALTRLLALQSRPAIQHPQTYHPASQSGQTWKEENISTANRTYQVHENKVSENERMKMNAPKNEDLKMPEPQERLSAIRQQKCSIHSGPELCDCLQSSAANSSSSPEFARSAGLSEGSSSALRHRRWPRTGPLPDRS